MKCLRSEWKVLLTRFLLNNLGKLTQDEVDMWLDDRLAFAELIEPALKNLAPHRDAVLRELYQISPSELFDVWRIEHPELRFPDTDVVIVRIGQELASIRTTVQSL